MLSLNCLKTNHYSQVVGCDFSGISSYAVVLVVTFCFPSVLCFFLKDFSLLYRSVTAFMC